MNIGTKVSDKYTSRDCEGVVGIVFAVIPEAERFMDFDVVIQWPGQFFQKLQSKNLIEVK